MDNISDYSNSGKNGSNDDLCLVVIHELIEFARSQIDFCDGRTSFWSWL